LQKSGEEETEEIEPAPDMAAVVTEAMGTLNQTIANQTDAIKSNGELVKKKKKVIRENGTIVGIETEE
jgi:hypothetical protein